MNDIDVGRLAESAWATLAMIIALCLIVLALAGTAWVLTWIAHQTMAAY